MIHGVKVSASILSADFSRLGEEIDNVTEGGADLIHIDVMDGHFVPNLTIGPGVVKAIKKSCQLPLDVHLMVENPEKYLDSFIEAGADFISVHQEATVHLQKIIKAIRDKDLIAGVVLNPATPLMCLEEILPECDMVLIMSVNPGFEGQSFIPSSLDKIKRLRKIINEKAKDVLIEVDGGIKPENSQLVKEAGADILVVGSSIFHRNTYDATISQIKGLVR
ncbi:MAG: ribulose-phosphate 3-epimerase [Candidatus Tectomicrobia bacterium]|uniref:Ribulose-phosphate 3-epimerase n=1 Tax=Tectimicrobiota bacterium TaxID=2528274 RepID=A0A933GME9_UNCTE|nr:ribulose-phosphate 3-epimerase [Candidatus Tectomicrobia bacterium]